MAREVPAVFGSVFHEDMPVLAFENGAWQSVRWQKAGELTLAPGAHCLHYGSECFEGLKAFRQQNGDIVLFRTDANITRMQQSAKLLHLPVPEAGAFIPHWWNWLRVPPMRFPMRPPPCICVLP